MASKLGDEWDKILATLNKSPGPAENLPEDWKKWLNEIDRMATMVNYQARPRAELDARLALYVGDRMQHALEVGIPALGELISSVLKLKNAVEGGAASLKTAADTANKAADTANKLNKSVVVLTVVATLLTGISALPVIRWLLGYASSP